MTTPAVLFVRTLLASTFCVYALVGPAQAGLFEANMAVNRIVPPREALGGISRIEVEKFSGYEGARMQSWVREALLAETRGAYDARHPTLNEGFRTNSYEIVTEGGDALLSGSTTVEEESESYEAREVRRDSDGNPVKDSDGKTLYRDVSCRKRIVTATVQWTLTNAGGAVLVQKSISRKSSDSGCGDELKNLDSRDELADRALLGAGTGIADAIAPRWEVHEVPLARDKSVVEGFRLVKDGNWEMAICNFRAVLAGDPYNVDALYDLGAVLELSGWYPAAADQYAKAVAVNGDTNASDGVGRVNGRLAQLAVLTGTLGQSYSASAPSYARCPKVPSGRPVRVRKDTTLLSAPEEGSPEIARLPKGMQLYVVDESGKLLKVVTGDGTEGWVSPKAVK